MSLNHKKFADDGWAVWINGEDTSTIYINDWLNPKGKSYVDFAVHIRGVKSSKSLNVYIPFVVSKEEIEDLSLFFHDANILQATFSASCLMDYKKNEYTSEIAYNGKTMDIVHISALDFKATPLSNGTHICVDFENILPYIDNDEAYFIWRMPHKSIDAIFMSNKSVKNVLRKLRDLITTPVVSENFGYSIRINESRLLPNEITKIGAFHRQKLKKAVITLSVNEKYELNDTGCYRIRRLEENLYKDYLPKNYNGNDVITYQWLQNRDDNYKGHFNFYYNIGRNTISRGSMLVYIILLLTVGVAGNLLADLVRSLIG